jgi:hypothetical protein
MTVPVATPTRHRIGVGIGVQASDRSAQFEPRTDRLLGVMLVRRGIAEKDEDAVPEAAGYKTAVATDDLRDAVLKGNDRVAQIFQTDPVGSHHRADHFARHGGDLPTFGCIMPRDPSLFRRFRRLLPRDFGFWVRQLGEGGLSADRFGYILGGVGCRAGRGGNGQGRSNLSRPNACRDLTDLASKLVASPCNCLDQVAVRSKGLAERPNLALEPVFLDDPAWPGSAQQLALADHRPWRLNQHQQQVEGASAEPYRPAVGQQLPAMRQDAEVAEFDNRRRVRQANHDP